MEVKERDTIFGIDGGWVISNGNVWEFLRDRSGMLDVADSVVIGGAFRWRWSWRMGMGKFVERIGTKKGRMGWEDVLDGVYHFCF